MDAWEKSRQVDRRLLGWIWSEDAKVRWWVWLIGSAWFLTSAVWDFAIGRTGLGVAGMAIGLWFIAVSILRRGRRPN